MKVETIGDRIRQARLKMGLSQDELAKMLNYKSRSTINKIELGEREIGSYDKLMWFAACLNVHPAWLLTGNADAPCNFVYISDYEDADHYYNLTSKQVMEVTEFIHYLMNRDNQEEKIASMLQYFKDANIDYEKLSRKLNPYGFLDPDE